MSNLTSGNCGCGTSCTSNTGIFGGSCIWILLLLFCGCGNGCGNSCGNGCGTGFLGGGDNGCDWLIWILLISCICGNGCGNGCGYSTSSNCGCNNSCC